MRKLLYFMGIFSLLTYGFSQEDSSVLPPFEYPEGIPPVEVVYPGDYQRLVISLRDINRFVCNSGEITGVVYSKEKLFEVKTSGRDAYVKLTPVKEGEKLLYDPRPRELFLDCGGQTYSFILIPKDVPSRTFYLRTSGVSQEDNKIKKFEAREYEKVLSDLIRHAYLEDIPPGYELEEDNKTVKKFEELDLVRRRIYKGLEFVVEEWIVMPNRDLSLDEASFIPYFPHVVAIALSKLKLFKGDQARLFVVRRNVK